MEDKLDIQPILPLNNWFKQVDITGSPSISLLHIGEETKSGILNGIKVLVDLGIMKFVFLFKKNYLRFFRNL